MTIAKRLNQAMIAARFESQKELSDKSGVPQPTICRILKGTGARGPETETLKKLARACNVTFEWLNEGNSGTISALKSAAERPVDADGESFADELVDIIRGYKNGSDEDRGMILRQARIVLDRRRRRTSGSAE